ncbi:hypothetical protein SAMN05216344_1245 [Polaromonas sp. OV174]|nr:hypothetical protein SAMN05216344_1245 [Polaromonas sp. OV174]
MFKTLQSNSAERLVASVVPMEEGYHLMLSTRNALGKSGEEFVRFQRQVTATELRELRDFLDEACPAKGSPGFPDSHCRASRRHSFK